MQFRARSPFALGLGLVIVSCATVWADVRDRLYDFTDAYYLQNGITPANISGRRQPVPPGATTDTPIFSYQRPVRSLRVSAAYDHSGKPWFFAVMGGGSATLFTNNAAGTFQRQVADSSIEYVFPKRGTDPLGLGATRQAVVLDMRNGYFSNNRLGIWLHVWVNYTDAAFNTATGRTELADLARRNGLAADGTPLLKTVGDIERLVSKRLATKQARPATDPLRYAFCPVIKDPTDGGIAADQTLSNPLRPDGTPVDPNFNRQFTSLQTTGRWAN
jgi:hypothetical protein